jgi:hypothetical protein
MSVAENLLNLRRRQCEERRRYLAELEFLAQRLGEDAGRLRAEIERTEASGDPAPARPLIARRIKLERSLAAVQSQIAAAGDALAAAEQELKRHELAAAQRAGRAAFSQRGGARRSRRGRPAAPAQ